MRVVALDVAVMPTYTSRRLARTYMQASGGGHHEEALAGEELRQGLPCAGGGLLPLGQRHLDQGVEEPDPSLRPPAPANTTPELHGPQQCQPEGRHYHGHPLQPGGAAAARLEVVRHVPPGEQVGNLGQLVDAAIERATGSHEVRYGGRNVGEQQQLPQGAVSLPVQPSDDSTREASQAPRLRPGFCHPGSEESCDILLRLIAAESHPA